MSDCNLKDKNSALKKTVLVSQIFISKIMFLIPRQAGIAKHQQSLDFDTFSLQGRINCILKKSVQSIPCNFGY